MATRITTKSVETLKHDEAKRKNIPSAEQQSFVQHEQENPKQIRYPRTAAGDSDEKSNRNRDLDPQLVWRGKDEQDWSDLVVNAPPLYIQEKVHPKVLIDDLLRTTKEREHEAGQTTADLFSDFNGIPKGADKTEFYQHDQNWTNRMILGDSLQVMASLAEREGLRGKVQCIYFDPPYGIKFNSNFQWSTTSRDVKDGKADHITREPEQVKAFRDTWRDGIHSYLTYLRDRLTVARDLLTESGSIFVQIGDENVHRVRAVMDEVFGEDNICALLVVRKTSSLNSPAARVNVIPGSADFVIWYAKRRDVVKYRQLYNEKTLAGDGGDHYRLVELPDSTIRPLAAKELIHPETLPPESKVMRADNLISQGYSEPLSQPFTFQGRPFNPGVTSHWKTTLPGMDKLSKSGRLLLTGKTLAYKRCFGDFPVMMVNSIWEDIGADSEKTYVVQTPTAAIRRCIVMATDPGDLVLDPTCGSGTTATVAEQWGRRWITIDTSRVALALARARIMGARYPFYLLADSREGQLKEAEVTRTAPSSLPVQGNIRHGFVYERVPHITLKSIANNAEIDVIWDQWQATLEPLREQLNMALGRVPHRHSREGGNSASAAAAPTSELDARLRGNDG
ncbi:MAG: site-specific DNA-methyltransferase, partial [Betaproteobacteria bacterium]